MLTKDQAKTLLTLIRRYDHAKERYSNLSHAYTRLLEESTKEVTEAEIQMLAFINVLTEEE